MKNIGIKRIIRSYGIDIENEDEFISDIGKAFADCFISCPTCGEYENLHENVNYKNDSSQKEVLCNECGEIFPIECFSHSVQPEVKLPSEEEYEISFGNHLQCGVRITNGSIEVIGAVNGWGDGVPLTDIIIKRLNPNVNFVETK